MALVECKECKHQVSDSAKTCPNCGVKNPGTGCLDTIIGLAFLIGIFWIFWG